MKINKTLIKAKLNERSLTPEAAAEKFGINPKAMRTILAYGNADGVSLGKIAKGLGMKAHELVEGGMKPW